MKTILLPLLASNLILLFSAYGQSTIQSELDALMKHNFQPDQPGGMVLVWEKGKIRYQQGIGLENLDTKKAITPTTTFRMASVSKQFTAMAILILEKQNKLKLEDKLSRYFPQLKPEIGDKIILKHLLTHTSGIPDYESLMDQSWNRQILDEDIPLLLASQPKGYFTPGSQFRYSNTGFCLLALVVKQVSGKPYAQFLKQYIFEPLEMNHTFIYENKHPVPGRGMGYARTEPGQIIPSDQSLTSATKGDGCVYTCIADYLKWYQACRTNTLADLLGKLSEIGYLFPKGSGEGYGLGWFFKKKKQGGNYELTHSGSTCGFSHVVVQVPDEDLLIVYFSNLADNHAVFDTIYDTVRKYSSYKIQLDFKQMHLLTN
ncbi:beta-lactamase family protein [Rhodocytophaga rosea]|uniref:Beta-lactamase family protein n=1 Tax=Rhodocytophaga rosea TaxID=2704465 RepID=A0A6C0GD18_9BACT|nr:serine hydrolase domain-containing protein [Rhodocytophaga rosea]QHT65713.1 beta-lactamase family protein [Rhodocytophaga rosea]